VIALVDSIRPPRAPDIRADDLRYLLAVARSARMVTAAAMLEVDHTTVARRIRALERSLGHRLLEPGADGWELTPLGRGVVAAASPIDEAISNVLDVTVGEGEGAVHGSVRLLAPDGFGTTFVVPALSEVLGRHPHLTIELVTATRPLSPRAAGFDVAVTIGVPTSKTLVSEKLTDYTLRLYASARYLESHDPIRTVDDLVEHPLIYYIDSMLTVADLDLRRSLGGMEVRFASTNILAQLAATEAGAGIGLLPSFLAESRPGLVPVLEDHVDYTLSIGLSARRESAGRAAVGIVRSALLAEVRRRADEVLASAGTAATSGTRA